MDLMYLRISLKLKINDLYCPKILTELEYIWLYIYIPCLITRLLYPITYLRIFTYIFMKSFGPSSWRVNRLHVHVYNISVSDIWYTRIIISSQTIYYIHDFNVTWIRSTMIYCVTSSWTRYFSISHICIY